MTTPQPHDGASTDNSITFQDAVEEQSTLPTLDFNVQWPSLQTLSKHIKRTGWHGRTMPAELTSLPDGLQLPEKLQHILNWSVTPGDSWASPPKLNVPADNDHNTPSLRSVSVVSPIDDEHRPFPDGHDRQSADNQSIHSSLSTALISDTSSVQFAAEKSAWKSRFLGRLARRKPVPKRLPPPRPPTPTAECIVCFEDLPITDLLQMDACRHYYCKDCLSRHTVVAMSAEANFPPKCCLTAIPLHTILLSLDNKQREEYQTKSAEYAIPPADRWYCPRTTCTRWIPPARLNIPRGAINYECPFCSETICRTCRGVGHAAGTECPQDFGLEQTLEVAEAEGWQRCYSCQALVEHTYGCRHMTCKCRAEFCYVCGAQWQTCACTENDAVNRRADVNRRRQERIDAANAELEEIARAIAEVEAMERAEAEARRIREEERQREEAEQLAALEQLRLEEEAARQAAEEEAERQWHEVIKRSFEDDMRRVHSLMLTILTHQQSALNSRHEAEENAVGGDTDDLVSNIDNKHNAMVETVNKRYGLKRTVLRSQQQQETEALGAQHEEEEDDMFVQIQVRLRGKANKESRMERMLAELRKGQEEALEELSKSHTQALYVLEVRKNVDLNGINGARAEEVETCKDQLGQRLLDSGVMVGADRKFFEIVTKRRLAMLELHREIGIAEITNREEPKGLQDWQAATCDPVLPDFNGDEEIRISSRVSGRNSYAGPSRYSAQMEGSVSESIPRIKESTDLYGDDEGLPEAHIPEVQVPKSNPQQDGYLQPMPPPTHLPPTPPSSAVSFEAPNARRMTADTVRRLEDSSQRLSPVHSRNESVTSISPSHERHNSFAGSVASGGSGDHRPSIASSKKSRSWFGRKKELSEEEVRRKMKELVGDAF